jgi:hypothetical protein
MNKRRVALWLTVGLLSLGLVGTMATVAVIKRLNTPEWSLPAPDRSHLPPAPDFHTTVAAAVTDLNLDAADLPDVFTPNNVCWQYARAVHDGRGGEMAAKLAVSAGTTSLRSTLHYSVERPFVQAVLPALINPGGWCDQADAWRDPAEPDPNNRPIPRKTPLIG